MPSTINAIPDKAKGQLRKNGGTADGNLAFQTNGTNAVLIDTSQNANFVSTGALTLPSGTTAQRPASPVNGMWRYSTSYAGVEAYSNGSWLNLTPIRTPINSAAPVLSGSAVVGSNVSVSTGTWNNSPTSYGYQWLANSVAISNATANVFTVTSSQLGANLSCNVTATNSAGTTGIAATSNTAGPVVATFNVQYLVVAGGGAGGGADAGPGGGGGAGGYVTNTITGVAHGVVYTATVGAGGVGGDYSNHPTNGSNSTLAGSGLTTVTAVGGGGGGSGRSGGADGYSGGSGGGAAAFNNGVHNGGSGTSGQGNAGSNSDSGYNPGGGGGASAAGTISNGGAGIANPISGSTFGQNVSGTYYVAGGGAGGYGTGGNGGGGIGGNSGNSYQGGGGSYGGGGGGSGGFGQQPTSAGGTGVVILSVPTAAFSNTYTGTVTITTSGANTIITFTGSGTYTS